MLGEGRYPVNCVSLNSSGLLAVGDCGGGLRVYHVQSAARVVLVTTIDLAAIFAKKMNTDEVKGKPSKKKFNIRLVREAFKKSVTFFTLEKGVKIGLR